MVYVAMIQALDDIFYLSEDHEDWKLILSKYSTLVSIRYILINIGDPRYKQTYWKLQELLPEHGDR